MTGVAPEPAGRAVARVLAGGLPDTPADIAAALMAVLSRAEAASVAVNPIPAGERTFYTVERTDGVGPAHIVLYDQRRQRWGYTLD